MVNVPRHPIIHFCSTIDLYCPHFLSIFVCNLFTFRSSPKPHGPLEQNWHECLLGGAFQFWIFSVNQKFNMAAIANSVFWLADISKNSQKPLDKFDYDIVEKMIRWSRNSRWQPLQFLTKDPIRAFNIFQVYQYFTIYR